MAPSARVPPPADVDRNLRHHFGRFRAISQLVDSRQLFLLRRGHFDLGRNRLGMVRNTQCTRRLPIRFASSRRWTGGDDVHLLVAASLFRRNELWLCYFETIASTAGTPQLAALGRCARADNGADGVRLETFAPSRCLRPV